MARARDGLIVDRTVFRLLLLILATFFRTVVARVRRGPLRPTWSFSFEATIRYMRSDWEATSGWPFERLRADMAARPYPRAFLRRVVTRDGELGGVPTRWFEPPSARPGAAVLYFHGGSFIYGSARTTHAEVLARLAFESGAVVVAPDYRLAPEHPRPAQIDDAVRV